MITNPTYFLIVFIKVHFYVSCGALHIFMTPYTTFVGIITSKPSRDLTRPPRIPGGLKGLLHVLNAIVIPTKVAYIDLILHLVLFVCSRMSKV